MLVSVAAISGCSTMKVDSHVLSDYDFSKIQTYQWTDAPDDVRYADDTAFSQELQVMLNNALLSRGWKEMKKDEAADVQVMYYVKLSEYDTYTVPPGNEDGHTTPGVTYDRNSKDWNYKEENADITMYRVEMAEVVLQISDITTQEKIWEGTLTTKVDRTRPPSEQAKVIFQAARRITAPIPGID